MKLPAPSIPPSGSRSRRAPDAVADCNAQAYPAQPVRIIVGFAAGSGSDILARLMAQWLTERLGQPIVIENRAGAGGNVGTEAVVKAPPDGYTLLKVVPANTVNDTLYDKLSFNFIRDIAPVAGMVRVPYVLVVNQSVPVTTVPEFIAYAKANPGKLNFASAGVGTGIHMSGELFKLMAGVNMVHVPYRGAGNAMTDLIGGQVQLMFDTTQASIPHIKAGKVRALAVTTAARSELLPDLPTIGDFVPGYEASGSFGFGAPRNTPAEIVEKLNREINAVLADPKAKARIAELGGEPLSARPPPTAGSWPRKPKSGARWSGPPTSSLCSAVSRLRIYGIARTRAFRALWTAMELGLDYEHIPIEIGYAGARSRNFWWSSRWPAPGDRRCGFVLMGITRDHALSREEAFVRRALSGVARKMKPDLAMEPVGAQRGGSWGEHLVAACHPPAARGSRSGQARGGAQGHREAVQGARRSPRRPGLSCARRVHRCRSQCCSGHQPGDRHGFFRNAAPCATGLRVASNGRPRLRRVVSGNCRTTPRRPTPSA